MFCSENNACEGSQTYVYYAVLFHVVSSKYITIDSELNNGSSYNPYVSANTYLLWEVFLHKTYVYSALHSHRRPRCCIIRWYHPNLSRLILNSRNISLNYFQFIILISQQYLSNVRGVSTAKWSMDWILSTYIR